jgi:hypothetical protein
MVTAATAPVPSPMAVTGVVSPIIPERALVVRISLPRLKLSCAETSRAPARGNRFFLRSSRGALRHDMIGA